MAICPRCKSNLSVKQLMNGILECQQCGGSLRYEPTEYKQITRPGIYIALFIVTNTFVVHEPRMRFIINIILLTLWFIFFKRFLDYLNKTTLEIVEEN